LIHDALSKKGLKKIKFHLQDVHYCASGICKNEKQKRVAILWMDKAENI
jgi:hypothetical protein